MTGDTHSGANEPAQAEPLVTIYTTTWCPDCHALKRFLEGRGLSYREVNIEEDSQAAELVMRLNEGRRSVPTAVAGEVAESLSRFSPGKAHEFLARAGLSRSGRA